MSTTVRVIEARRVVDSLLGRISAETIPMPNVGAVGEGFAYPFDRWLVDDVDWLRLPSGV